MMKKIGRVHRFLGTWRRWFGNLILILHLKKIISGKLSTKISKLFFPTPHSNHFRSLQAPVTYVLNQRGKNSHNFRYAGIHRDKNQYQTNPEARMQKYLHKTSNHTDYSDLNPQARDAKKPTKVSATMLLRIHDKPLLTPSLVQFSQNVGRFLYANINFFRIVILAEHSNHSNQHEHAFVYSEKNVYAAAASHRRIARNRSV